MDREKIDQPDEIRNPIARVWVRIVDRNRARRRAVTLVSHQRKVENRFLPSLHEIWMILAGTHESRPK